MSAEKKLIITIGDNSYIRTFTDDKIGSAICEACAINMEHKIHLFLNKYHFIIQRNQE